MNPMASPIWALALGAGWVKKSGWLRGQPKTERASTLCSSSLSQYWEGTGENEMVIQHVDVLERVQGSS